jgi:hypothetical protein
MLSGEDQGRRMAARGERTNDGSQFDRFGSGADDQSDVGKTQPSP